MGRVDDPDQWLRILTESADLVVKALGELNADWGVTIGLGADGSATAAADQVAEDASLGFFADTVPGVTLCSEEAGVVQGDGDVTLIVDPVDGTNNAIRGLPYWAYSVAVLLEGQPVGGFVRNIPSGHDLFGWRGQGVTLNGRVVDISSTTHLRDAVFGMQRPAEPGAFEVGRRIMSSAKLVRLLGAAALDIAYVGAGIVDGYANVNTNRLFPFGEKVVDFAAGAIILEANGGVITDTSGAPLSYDTDLKARIPVAAACSASLHEQLLAKLSDSA